MEKRTHDKFYLSEDRKKTPKEYFKFLASVNDIGNAKNAEILDIGCATGDFIYYLHSINPNLKYSGLDVMPELLEVAKKECSYAEFYNGDIFTGGGGLPSVKYDCIFLNGVHPIFNDLSPIFSNLFKLGKKNTVVNIFGIFNPEELDVVIKSKRYDETDWEIGWNLFSVQSLSRILKENYDNIEFEFLPWNIDIDMPQNKTDPYRSYTINMADNSKLVINGLQLVHRFYLLRIKLAG